MENRINIINPLGLFSIEEHQRITEDFEKLNIEVVFFSKNTIQASLSSCVEVIISLKILDSLTGDLVTSAVYDVLKTMINKILNRIKEKRLIKVDSSRNQENVSMIIKTSTTKGVISLELRQSSDTDSIDSAISKMIEARCLFDDETFDGDMYIIEIDNEFQIMNLEEYVRYRRQKMKKN